MTDEMKMRSEENVNAKESIYIIKSTIGKSKFALHYLYLWLLICGGTIFLIGLLEAILKHAFPSSSFVEKIFVFLNVVMAASLLAYYFIKRTQLVRSDSKYGLQIYDIWGISIFLPLIMQILHSKLSGSWGYRACFEACVSGIGVFLIIVALFLTGILIKNKKITVISLAILISFLVYM